MRQGRTNKNKKTQQKYFSFLHHIPIIIIIIITRYNLNINLRNNKIRWQNGIREEEQDNSLMLMFVF